MLRALMTGKGIALTLVTLAAIGCCVYLGRWQLDRARPDPLPVPTSLAAVALTDVAAVGSPLAPRAVGRQVTATGVYVESQQLFVVERGAKDTVESTGYWVLTPLRTSSGDLLPVVRGWTADRGSTPPPPAGTVQVTGILQTSENSALAPRLTSEPLQTDEVAIISTAELIGIYPTREVYDGFVVLDPPSSGLSPVNTEVVRAEGWHLLNAGYALQWWLFAGFAAFFWFRWLRETARESTPLTELANRTQESSWPPAR